MDLLGTVLLASIAACVVALSVTWVWLRPKPAALILLGVAILPLFFDPSRRSLTLLQARTVGDVDDAANGALHVGVVVVVSLFAVQLLRHAGLPQKLFGKGLFLILGAWLTGALVVGTLAGSAGVLGGLFYAQTLLPILAWYAVASCGSFDPARVSDVVLGATLVTLLFVLGVAFTSGGLSGGYEVVDALVSVIPQYRSYYSLIPAVGLAYGVVSLDRRPVLSLCVVAAVLLSLPLMWSRAGLLMVVVAGLVAFVAKQGRPGVVAARLMLAVVLVAGTGGLMLRIMLGGVLAARAGAGSTVEASGDSRLRLAHMALGRIWDNPIFGDAFTPYSNRLAGGTVVDLERLFPAHNQYLDLALRAGVPAMLLCTAVLVAFARRSFRIARGEDDSAPFHAALLGVIVAVMLGNLTHLWLVQTWSGVLFFALLGVSSTYLLPPESPRDRRRALSGITPQAPSPTARRGRSQPSTTDGAPGG